MEKVIDIYFTHSIQKASCLYQTQEDETDINYDKYIQPAYYHFSKIQTRIYNLAAYWLILIISKQTFILCVDEGWPFP